MSSATPKTDLTVPAGAASCAVLASGGVESSVLVAELSRVYRRVYPIYVREGLVWEAVEQGRLRQFLEAIGGDRAPAKGEGTGAAIAPLVELWLPVNDVYQGHWSITGQGIPDAQSPDEAMYLPGRNLLLLSKAAVWCHLNGVGALALGTLGTNPFPDSTPEFYRDFEATFNRAVGGELRVLRPFSPLTKAEVIRRGRELPLGLTFSCVSPVGGEHCGRCNKCEERRRGFEAAGVVDPTVYAAAR